MINVCHYPAQFKKPYQITGNYFVALKQNSLILQIWFS